MSPRSFTILLVLASLFVTSCGIAVYRLNEIERTYAAEDRV